jgi:hypothetical protein
VVGLVVGGGVEDPGVVVPRDVAADRDVVGVAGDAACAAVRASLQEPPALAPST